MLGGAAALSAAPALASDPGAGAAHAKRQAHPNIIYIMTDQHSANALSCAGNPYLKTPNIDRFAEHGVRFTNAYCAMPLSGPSRASMFTGYMPSEIGMNENEMPLCDSLRNSTLGSLVAQAGYECAYAGKWHVNTISLPSEHAFGFRNIKDNGDAGIADACIGFLRGREGSSTPFFLVASYTNPHNICEAARGQKTPHADVSYSSPEKRPALPENFAINADDAKVLQFERRQNYSLYPSVDYADEDWINYRDIYFRLVEAVDAEIGKIVDEIDRQNLWDNTIVIFTSDHGDGQGAHHWNQKTVLYEEVANIPLIVCLPGGKNAGGVSEALVCNGVDLMPSLCDWAGARVPAGRTGVSIRPACENPDSEMLREYLVTETNFNQTGGTKGWLVRSSDYKYVVYDKGLHREQLFDMRSDRLEMHNLAESPEFRSVLDAHRKALRDWLSARSFPDKALRLKVSRPSGLE